MSKPNFRAVDKGTGAYIDDDSGIMAIYIIYKKILGWSWKDFTREFKTLDTKMKAQVKREYATLHQRERRKRDNGG